MVSASPMFGLLLAGFSVLPVGVSPAAQPRTDPACRTQGAVVVHVDPRRFSWGDAGIGAAGGVGLSMVGAGAFVMKGRRSAGRDISAHGPGPEPGPPLPTGLDAAHDRQEAF